MKRFQAALKSHLVKQNDRLTLEFREMVSRIVKPDYYFIHILMHFLLSLQTLLLHYRIIAVIVLTI